MRKPIPGPDVLWPALVILLLAAGIGSAFAVLYFSRIDGGAEIVSDYYGRGLVWDSTASSQRAVSRFGWTIDLESADSSDGTGMRAIRVAVTDSAGLPVAGLAMDIEASRPHIAIPVARGTAQAHLQPGVYVVWLPVRETGLWDFTVNGRNGPIPFTMRFRREILR